MKHEIEIPDFPEGWDAVAYRIPIQNKDYVFVSNQVILCVWPTRSKHIIASKKQPRRIVLEEVEAGHEKVEFFHDRRCWKIVEDNKCAE